MMSIYGLLGGVGQGLADTGQMMQKDALEMRREKRLEEARMRQEQRANTEWSRRQDTTRGFALEDRDNDRAFKYGSENLDAVTEQGSFGYEKGAENDQWMERNEITHGQAVDLKNLGHSQALSREEHKNSLEKGSAESGYEPPGATELNHAHRVIITQFGGQLDQNGNIIKPPDAPEKVSEAYAMVVELVKQGDDLGTAVAKALQSVGHLVSEDEARRMATEESKDQKFGFFGGSKRDEWVANRQREIMDQRRMESQGLIGGAPSPNQHAATLQQAEQAIAQGANPDAVRERLIELGVPENQINF